VLKIIPDKQSNRLGYLEEPGKGGLEKFFDKSKAGVGKQSIQNRFKHLSLIHQPWNNANLSNNLSKWHFYQNKI